MRSEIIEREEKRDQMRSQIRETERERERGSYQRQQPRRVKQISAMADGGLEERDGEDIERLMRSEISSRKLMGGTKLRGLVYF